MVIFAAVDVWPVSLMGSVPHSEALAHMKNMNCLLMYHVERLGAREVVTENCLIIYLRASLYCAFRLWIWRAWLWSGKGSSVKWPTLRI